MRSFPEQVSQEWVDGEVDSWNKLGREREAGWKKEGWTGIVAAPGKGGIMLLKLHATYTYANKATPLIMPLPVCLWELFAFKSPQYNEEIIC